MEFEIVFYTDNRGWSPIKTFLLELKKSNSPLAEQAFKGLEKLKNSAYHREPLSKHIEAGLWELRIRSGSDILRIFYTFEKGRIIVLLHIFIKKKQKIPKGELDIARKRLKEIKLQEVN